MTPLQMAMLAAGIANGGTVMKPYVIDRITTPKGGTVTRTHPEKLSQAVSPETAAALTKMMEAVVQVGHGHGGADLGRAGGGQDRNGGDRRERDQHHVVHRVRARERAEGRRRRLPREPARHGRPHRSADREDHLGNASPTPSVTCSRGCRPPTASSTRSSTGGTRSSASWAPAGWRTCTSPRTRSSAAAWRSRCSTSGTRGTSSSSSGSGARRRTPPASRTRTSSRSTTAGSRTAPTTSRWSTSTGARSRSCSSRAGRRRSRSRSTTRGRSSPRSGSPTGTASSTATSSRTTSRSPRTAG